MLRFWRMKTLPKKTLNPLCLCRRVTEKNDAAESTTAIHEIAQKSHKKLYQSSLIEILFLVILIKIHYLLYQLIGSLFLIGRYRDRLSIANLLRCTKNPRFIIRSLRNHGGSQGLYTVSSQMTVIDLFIYFLTVQDFFLLCAQTN